MSNYIPLESLEIARPCHADWKKMQGDDRVRFCQTCAKNVYNLSGMPRTEAEALVREKNGNLCIQLMRRADGTVITDECPVGLRIMRLPYRWAAGALLLVLTPLVALLNATASAAPAKTGSSLAKCAQIVRKLENAGRATPVMRTAGKPAITSIRGDMAATTVPMGEPPPISIPPKPLPGSKHTNGGGKPAPRSKPTPGSKTHHR